MALQLWDTFKESITEYTGLSPATFFTVLALGLAVYYTLSTLFGSSDDGHPRSRGVEEQMEPLPPPVQLGEITDEVLKQYDGYDPKKPLLMAIKGQIYDVSQSRDANHQDLLHITRGGWTHDEISAAISPDERSSAFKEVAIVRHPRIGQYTFGFITSTVVLQKTSGEELCCVHIPTNHLYLGNRHSVPKKIAVLD